MDEFLKELEKLVKAGVGAVAVGVEKASQAVDKLAQKGEPIYEQAKTAVTGTVEKITKAFKDLGKPKLGDMLHDAADLSTEDLKALRLGLDALIAEKEQAPAEAPAAPAEVETTSETTEA